MIEPVITSIRKGEIDKAKEYFMLFYFDAALEWAEQKPVALVGFPEKEVVKVQYLVDSSSPESVEMVGHIDREIKFYLIDKSESDPWRYARHHCNTASNLYSPVHWYFVDSNQR